MDLLSQVHFSQPLAILTPRMFAPPSLQDTLRDLVEGAQVSSSHTMQLPLLVKRRTAVVQRSIDLLRIFRVIQNTSEALSGQVCPRACPANDVSQIQALSLRAASGSSQLLYPFKMVFGSWCVRGMLEACVRHRGGVPDCE